MSDPLMVGIRFSKIGKIYHFDASAIPDLQVGDQVVVETSRGWQLGQVAQLFAGDKVLQEGSLKAVERRASPRDLLMRQMWQAKENDVLQLCTRQAAQVRLKGVKFVSAEFSFDGSRLLVQFSTETEDKVDVKQVRQELQKTYSQSQIEMRQIGPRDVAKLMCGMGACGLETRCCCRFLTEFSSISIRMAKEQDISLTPSEITGMCGRLRCCLIYEYDLYVEARKSLPKKNKRVMTPSGEGRVVGGAPLREMVLVEFPDDGTREFHYTEVQILEEGQLAPPPVPRPIEKPLPITPAPRPQTTIPHLPPRKPGQPSGAESRQVEKYKGGKPGSRRPRR